MTATATELTAKQAKVLCALLAGQTIDNAAENCGLTSQTVYRWLKGDANFNEEYRAARRAVVSQAIATLQTACCEAVATLREITTDADAPASTRVSAARAILDTSIKAVELEDLAQRIEVLEAALENKTETPKRW